MRFDRRLTEEDKRLLLRVTQSYSYNYYGLVDKYQTVESLYPKCDIYKASIRNRVVGFVVLKRTRMDNGEALEFHVLAAHSRLFNRSAIIEFGEFLMERAQVYGVVQLQTLVKQERTGLKRILSILGFKESGEVFAVFATFTIMTREVHNAARTNIARD